MNTQTHALMGAFFFGKALPLRAIIGTIGGLLPDLPMISIVIALKASGYSGNQIFDEMYWQNWWQITNAIGHSFLLWGGLLCLGLLLRKAPEDYWSLATAFAAAGFLHCCIDFCCHREDAHMHLWPLSRYKFMSPVSYYDPAHYGLIFSLFEAALGLAMSVILMRQFSNIILRVILLIVSLLYMAIPAMLIFGAL
jgi:membrane-bound metal-dependent hydrolase YbcI (DUF457 family)